jgi:hypothetical protein
MHIQHPSTFYAHVKVDISNDLMKHVIGVKGKWFKYTCNKCDVSNIWYNKKRNIVEIWGPINNLMTAFYAIENRIKIIKDRFHIDKSEDVLTWPADDYFEFPLSDAMEGGYDDHIVKRLIGTTGHNFKRITRESGVSFIWYNHHQKVIQIWGLSEDIRTATGMLQSKLTKLTSGEHAVEGTSSSDLLMT